MENNTKIAIGLAAAVVVGYIVYKSSKPKTTMPDEIDPLMPTDAGSDVIEVLDEKYTTELK